MHATIVQLTRNKHDWQYPVDENDVFADNQEKFYDGVEERKGDGFKEDVDSLCASLGEAIVGRGTEKDEDRDVTWIDVDTSKTDHLFKEPFNRFRAAVTKLSEMDIGMFTADSDYRVYSALREIREAYDDDGLHILDTRGYAKPMGEWLRDIKRDAKREGQGVIRFYAHASYDGNQ